MGTELHGQDPLERRILGRYQGWNEYQHSEKQWKSWLRRCMIAMGVAHLALFIFFPAWDVTSFFPDPDDEAILFWDLTPAGAIGDPIDNAATALRAPEEIEIDEAIAGSGEDEITESPENPNLLQLFANPEPEIIPYLTTTAGIASSRPPPPPPVTMLDLELAAINPRPARLPPTINYPLIRNPLAVVRFLRTRYNPIYQERGTKGSVTVMMWINESGSVDWSEVQESSGDAALDEIALAVFNEVAVFRAARSEGTRIPVAVIMSVPLSLPW